MKKNGLFLISLLVLILSLGVLSCEVGLGAQVDTVAPTVKINTPPTNATIRDNFAIAGTWRDDGNIRSVAIDIKRTDNIPYEAKHLTGTVNKNGAGTWSCVIPGTDYLDGKYEAVISLTDDGNHTTTQSRVFTIDNTPPIVIIDRPSTIVDGSESESYDIFGQKILLTGECADDSNVALMKVNFFKTQEDMKNFELHSNNESLSIEEQKDLGLVATVEKHNVTPSFNHDLIIKNKGDDYANLYLNLDTEDPKILTRSRYYSLKTYDNAQRFPIDGPQTEKDKLGNCAYNYYLRKTVANLLEVDGYKITELYSILNKTYGLVSDAPSKNVVANNNDKINEIATFLANPDNTITGKGVFNINPNNDPTYSIQGMLPFTNMIGFDKPEAVKTNGEGTTITLEVEQGLDKNTIIKDSLKVYLYPVTGWNEKDGFITNDNYRVLLENKDTVNKAVTISASASNYNIVLKPRFNKTEIPTGVQYIVKVEGYDTNGIKKGEDGQLTYTNNIVPKGIGQYGFFYRSTQDNSSVVIDKLTRKPKSSTEEGVTTNCFTYGDEITVYGHIEGKYEDKDELKISLNGKVTPEYTLNGQDLKTKDHKFSYTFVEKYTAREGNEHFAENQNITVTCNLVRKENNTDGSVRETKLGGASREFYFDTSAPELKIMAPIQDSGVYGQTKIMGTISDNFAGVLKIDYELIQTGKKSINGSVPANKVNGVNWGVDVDFEQSGNVFSEGLVTLKCAAVDKLGNNENLPEIKFYLDKTPPKLTEKNKYSIVSNDLVTLSGTVEDDNAVATNDQKLVSITITGSDKKPHTYTNKDVDSKIVVKRDGEKKANWELQLVPSSKTDSYPKAIALADDEFTLAFAAYDITGKIANETKSLIFDTVSPSGELSGIKQEGWYTTTKIPVKVINCSDDRGKVSVNASIGKASASLDLSKDTEKCYVGNVNASEGENQNLVVTISDVAGNTKKIEQTVSIDETDPEVTLESIKDGEKDITDASNKLVNGKQDVTITVNALDSTSKIASVELVKICGNDAAIKSTDNKNLVIPTEWFTNKSGKGKVEVKVVDVAGNQIVKELFTMTMDTAAPVASINVIPDADLGTSDVDVNKVITISGTVSDDNQLSEAWLQYKKSSETWDNPEKINLMNEGYNWSVELDTGKLNDDNLYDFRVYAKDIAGNIFTETPENTKPVAYKTVKVNQDSDIPIITFTNYIENGVLGVNELLGNITDDDGLIEKIFYSTEVPEVWNEIKVSNGSWKLPELADGKKTYTFKVTDKAGTEWTTSKLKGSDGNLFKGDLGKVGKLALNVDTTAPVVTDIVYKVGGNVVKDIAAAKIGGTNKLLEVTFSATDANLQEGGTLVGGVSIEGITDSNLKMVKGDGNTYSISYTFADSSINGFKTMKYWVEDATGKKTEETVQLNIDNTAPVIKITQPLETSILSGSTTAIGNVNEESTVSFAVTANNNQPTSGFTELEATSGWELIFDGAKKDSKLVKGHTEVLNTWVKTLYPESDMETRGETAIYLWIKAVDSVGNVGYESRKMTVDPQGDRPELVISNPPVTTESPIPGASGALRFFGSVGDTKGANPGVDSVWMQVISDGRREGVKGDYYNNDSAATPTMKDFSLTADDMKFMQEAFGAENIVKISDGKTQWNGSDENYSDYGVKTALKPNGTWSMEINSNDKFNANAAQLKKEVKTNVVGVKFIAKDKDGRLSISRVKEGSPEKEVQYNGSLINVMFDSDKPIISDLKLVNTDGRTVAYTPDMYISGKSGWSLQGTITDNEVVKTIRVKDQNIEGSRVSILGGTTNSVDKAETSDNGKTYTFTYKLDRKDSGTADTSNKTEKDVAAISLLLDACDDSDGKNTIEQYISINVDNLAPAISYKGESGYGIDENIKQKNSFYTFGSKATEDATGVSQSGVAFVAAYFQRESDIINPLLSRGTGKENFTATSGEVGKDGLWWATKTVKSYTNDANNQTATLVLSGSVANDKNIHVNGLVKINNVYYLITNIAGANITINNILSGEVTSASFANAFIINNPIQETGKADTTPEADGYYADGNVVNDDGDRMIEVCKKTGSAWDWEASICSKNIPDGAVELHYVVFDNAGNYTIGSEKKIEGEIPKDTHIDAYVKNNSPRIAGFKLETGGTTYNSNSITLEANRAKYITSNPANGTPTFNWDERVYNSVNKEPIPTSRTFGSKLEEVATLGEQTTITPEIVGGNGDIYYKFEIGETGEEKKTWSATNTTKKLTSGTIDYTVSDSGKLVLQKGDLFKIGRTITDPGSNAIPFKFTFADSTYRKNGYEGVDRFSDNDSQKADMTIYFKLKGVGAAPVVTIKDFYWNSMFDNSLYEENTANGHIELPENWKNVDKTNISIKDIADLIDNDAKVSGKIKIEGTVTCDSGIGSISYTLPGVVKKTVKNLVQATKQPTLGENDFVFFITESKSSDGTVITAKNKEKVTPTSIKWTILWNTESVNNKMVALNQVISVEAKNKGIPNCPELENGTSEWLSIDGTTYYGAEDFDANKAKTSTPVTKQVDVVPYITGFQKVDASGNKLFDYGRAKSGAFALARNDSGLKFSGFNIPGGNITKAELAKGEKKYPVAISDKGICTIPEYAKNGDFVVTVSDGTNAIPAMNSVNDNNAPYNREFAGYDPIFRIADFSDDRYVHVWRVSEDDVFQGSKDCSIPTMTRDPDDGTLYAAFSNGGYGSIFTSHVFINGKSDKFVQGSTTNAASNGDKTTTDGAITGLDRAYSYNNAPSNIDISVPGSTHNGRKDISLAYGAIYRHYDDTTWEKNTSYKFDNSGGMYIYNNQDYTSQSFLNGDKPTRAHRGQLYSYDHYMDQFQNMKTARNGDYIYSAYYDKLNKSVNFTSVRAFRNGKNDTGTIGNSVLETRDAAFPWISIDGGKMPELTKAGQQAQWNVPGKTPADFNPIYWSNCPMTFEDGKKQTNGITVEVGTPFNLTHPSTNTRALETGEYVGLAINGKGCPVIVYTADDKIRVASSSSVSGTLGYLKRNSEYQVWGNIDAKPMVTNSNYQDHLSGKSVHGAYDIDGSHRSLMWNVQTLDLPTTYGIPSGYIDCAIDKLGCLHIAYKTKSGHLVYVKSNAPTETVKAEGAEFNQATNGNDSLRPATYTFGTPVLVDKGGSDISIELDSNNNPYISYIVTAEALDGMKIAFPYDVNGDEDTNVLDEFETMTVPSNVVVKASKACIAPDAKASDFGKSDNNPSGASNIGKYKAAVGIFCGTDYRSMFYVGEETTTENQNTEPQTPTDGSVTN